LSPDPGPLPELPAASLAGARHERLLPRLVPDASDADATSHDHEVLMLRAADPFEESLAQLSGTSSAESASAELGIQPAPDAPFTIPGLARHERVERLVNIVLGSLALVVSTPLMLCIAIAVRLTSRGPVLYKQPRIGIDRRGIRVHARRRADRRWTLLARFLADHDNQRAHDLGGSVFMIYKFRTMCEDAERRTGAVWAVRDDPRSTPIGCFLRKYRLDELPQLVNVLKGDMNIVGPRPERPSIFARMCEEIDDYALRQRAKPGITGWAQIHLLYDSCIDDVRKKVRYDLEYLRQKSVLRDLKIMVKTLPSVLFKRRGW
jgi:lipopolysaccharide/colanic/teichoic acid biosynthesis glycosyltransferase